MNNAKQRKTTKKSRLQSKTLKISQEVALYSIVSGKVWTSNSTVLSAVDIEWQEQVSSKKNNKRIPETSINDDYNSRNILQTIVSVISSKRRDCIYDEATTDVKK